MENLDDIFSRPPVPNGWNGQCFGCSKHNEHGLQLDFYIKNNKCYSKITVPSYYCGFEGIVHGGITALLLDEIAAWTLGVNKVKMGFTLKSTNEYLHPVPTEKELILMGKILKEKDDIITIYSEVKNREGEVYAKCSSIWKIPDLQLMSKLTGVELSKLKGMVGNLVQPLKEYKKMHLDSAES